MITIEGESSRKITIKVKDGKTYEVARGILLGDFVEYISEDLPVKTAVAVINNRTRGYHYRLTESSKVELLPLYSHEGLRTMRRTARFILTKAAADINPERRFVLSHTISNGLYAEFTDAPTTPDDVEKIRARMEELIAQDIKIIRHETDLATATDIFVKQNQPEKIELMRYRNKEIIYLFEMEGYYDYFYNHVGYTGGIVGEFRLLPYRNGMILQLQNEDGIIPPYHEQKKLFQVYQEGKCWGETLGVQNVADLNKVTKNQELNRLILVNEALQEKRIAYIADQICLNPETRIVLISGPSSSGKTTFSERLAIQLRANGKKPITISLDNYFVNRWETPRDEQGELDFEAFEAVNYTLFNEHLLRLLAGEKVLVPRFDFLSGLSQPDAIPLQIPNGEPIIVEGIHALNEKLTFAVPAEKKFKIFVSVINQLNLDTDTPIPTTDSRLLRRIVRDYRTRGHDALNTIKRWPSVRRGEEANIFPYQENADIFFNSALIYELAIIKALVYPLLRDIPLEAVERQEAFRLIELLSYVRWVSLNDVRIPFNSLLREFVGEA